jgi:DNA repair protein RadC
MAAGAYLLDRSHGWTEERIGLMALNARGDLLATRILVQGPKVPPIDPKDFFREALRYGATMVIAFLNHTDGDPTPTRDDTQLARRLQATGETLGVPLADLIVIGKDKFHSFRAAEAGWDRTN